ncbi:hypothetical protein AY599_12035 [Leptolyngbya valderiana BDU 20041]|nr:hypothetical protein AY599_12035 [Leptolyngbya valderiana BDU 20041]
MSKTATILDQLERVSGRLEAARQFVLAGEPVMLDPIEAEIRGICTAVAALPDGERNAFRRPLVGLLSELDDLSGQMREALERMGQELGHTSRRRAAVSAYGKLDTGGKPGGSGR